MDEMKEQTEYVMNHVNHLETEYDKLIVLMHSLLDTLIQGKDSFISLLQCMGDRRNGDNQDRGRNNPGLSSIPEYLNPADYVEGKPAPNSASVIAKLITVSGFYVVYILDNGTIQYIIANSYFRGLTTEDKKRFCDRLNDVMIDVNKLKVYASKVLKASKQRDSIVEYDSRLAMAIAAFITSWEDDTVAVEIQSIKDELEKRAKEKFRSSVLKNLCFWSLISLILIFVVPRTMGVMWYTASSNWFLLLAYAPFGMLGACLSIATKQEKCFPDPSIWEKLLFKEVATKVIVGGLSAWLLLMFIEAGFMVDIAAGSPGKDRVMVMVLFAIAAGYSERMVGSLLGKDGAELKIQTINKPQQRTAQVTNIG